MSGESTKMGLRRFRLWSQVCTYAVVVHGKLSRKVFTLPHNSVTQLLVPERLQIAFDVRGPKWSLTLPAGLKRTPVNYGLSQMEVQYQA
jgi:hypothetical protein